MGPKKGTNTPMYDTPPPTRASAGASSTRPNPNTHTEEAPLLDPPDLDSLRLCDYARMSPAERSRPRGALVTIRRGDRTIVIDLRRFYGDAPGAVLPFLLDDVLTEQIERLWRQYGIASKASGNEMILYLRAPSHLIDRLARGVVELLKERERAVLGAEGQRRLLEEFRALELGRRERAQRAKLIREHSRREELREKEVEELERMFLL
jgi:hypothetical protein